MRDPKEILAEHLADCCSVALKKEGFFVYQGSKLHDELVQLFQFNLTLQGGQSK